MYFGRQSEEVDESVGDVEVLVWRAGTDLSRHAHVTVRSRPHPDHAHPDHAHPAQGEHELFFLLLYFFFFFFPFFSEIIIRVTSGLPDNV